MLQSTVWMQTDISHRKNTVPDSPSIRETEENNVWREFSAVSACAPRTHAHATHLFMLSSPCAVGVTLAPPSKSAYRL